MTDHHAPDTSATDLGEPRRLRVMTKKPGRIDIEDPFALMLMAARVAMAEKPTLALSKCSVTELQAMCRLMCGVSAIAIASAELHAAIISGAPKDQLKQLRIALAEATAPFIGTEPA